jgi:2-keto-4-pentenoate hydratase
VVGRKIGLTSAAVQEQLGVSEPDYGALLASRRYGAPGGYATASHSTFLQPRVEGEIAFLIARPPGGSDVSIDDVLAVTEAVAPAIEIVDSRIADWRIALADTIADNASFGGYVVGPWSADLLAEDLREVPMVLEGGYSPVQGVGAAALGHPAAAVAWLLSRLAELGVEIEPGDVVLSGALAPMLPAKRGETYTLRLADQTPLALTFD